MKEKLIIRNFGPIKDVELDLGRFNIIIGENATGKSTIVKVLAVCRYFSYLLPRNFFDNSFEEGLISRGLGDFIKYNSFIQYTCKHYTFTAERFLEKIPNRDQEGEEYISEMPAFSSDLKPLSGEFRLLLEELERIKPKAEGLYDFSVFGWTIPTSFFLNDVVKVMDNPVYMPTERGLQSIFSLGKNSIQNISDSLFNQFAKLDQIARLFKTDTIIEPLNITYKNKEGRGYIKKNDENDFYDLNNGASGYQSTIPIVLMIKYYTDTKFNRKNKTFIIEEPELNLYPNAQQKLVQYLVDKTMSYGNSILMTTHSPYILTSLNNLMYAYQVAQKFKEETSQIVEEKYWLNPDEFSAYMLLVDGTCEDIVDNDKGEKLIRAERIDDISNQLNTDFDRLIDIEIANTKK